MGVQGKSFSGSGKSKCKAPEAGTSLVPFAEQVGNGKSGMTSMWSIAGSEIRV